MTFCGLAIVLQSTGGVLVFEEFKNLQASSAITLRGKRRAASSAGEGMSSAQAAARRMRP